MIGGATHYHRCAACLALIPCGEECERPPSWQAGFWYAPPWEACCACAPEIPRGFCQLQYVGPGKYQIVILPRGIRGGVATIEAESAEYGLWLKNEFCKEYLRQRGIDPSVGRWGEKPGTPKKQQG